MDVIRTLLAIYGGDEEEIVTRLAVYEGLLGEFYRNQNQENLALLHEGFQKKLLKAQEIEEGREK